MVANRNALKSYAPQARKDFIQAMTNRAALFGITKAGAADGEERGELFILDGKAFPKSVAEQRKRLIDRIAATSFDQALEAVAYTWFNRFLAIRYMELHGYLDHGYRVLSHPAGEAEPEILQQAQHLTLPGLDPDVVVDLKLKGDQDEALYRQILIAQCNDLHRAMPFLFERIEDETELLLPENLLQSDSIIRKLVNQIAESEWDEIEIIGWLYQFYISEKKDQVIGKVVKSEDIPAATQLFTPNWIVKYMVQNSLGAQWLATYPDSPLRAAMAYYVEPADQTPEVQAQLIAITPKTLDPEALTLIDPAVGSGHILVEAYDLFRAIYIERGYTPQVSARLILTKNLFGLDIDDRAAQMAGFALMMKARADDRSLLRDPPALNVMSLVDSRGWDAPAMADILAPRGAGELSAAEDFGQPALPTTKDEARAAISSIVARFDGAKTFGSLITVPDKLMASLQVLEGLCAEPTDRDLLRRQEQLVAKENLAALIKQARTLGRRYNFVVANPPYMGGKSMSTALKNYASNRYPNSKSDLFAMFIDRSFSYLQSFGCGALVTMQSWLYLSSYKNMRENLLNFRDIRSLSHMDNGLMGIAFGTTATIWSEGRVPGYRGTYFWVSRDNKSGLDKRGNFPPVDGSRESVFNLDSSQFTRIPTSPIAYSAPEVVRLSFESGLIDQQFFSEGYLKTGNNEIYIRYHWEISHADIFADGPWRIHPKGGEYRKWAGDVETVVRWTPESIRHYQTDPISRLLDEKYWNSEGIWWPSVSSGRPSFRFLQSDHIANNAALVIFPKSSEHLLLGLAYLNSKLGSYFLKYINQTVNFLVGDVLRLPKLKIESDISTEDILSCIRSSRDDWNEYEVSLSFSKNNLLKASKSTALKDDLETIVDLNAQKVLELKKREESINSALIKSYGLADELTPEVQLNEITLTCNPHYRYGGDLTDAEREARLLSDTMRELVSYGVGLMMGRYSLAEPGLIYAHAGNEGFDPSRYGAFPADDDGIVPITEEPWFADDAATRIEQFLAIAWPQAPIGETLATLIDGLTQGKGGEPRAVLRAYLAKTFYKDHLQTYRNRPIYWLFSSGKQKAFECLVYLHRYNESTLARMRTAYVTPLMGKMQQRIADLEAEIAGSGSSAEKTRKGRDREKTIKQLAELRAFDEELRHLADQRIALDLDDGVKVNYGRLGNLLAAKDKVCGKDNDKDD